MFKRLQSAVYNVDAFADKRYSFSEVIVLIDLFFKLFNAVISQLGAYHNSAETSEHSPDQGNYCDYYS